MASWIMFGVLLILLETHYVSGICEEYYFDADTQNVSLTFTFAWETNETKHVRCLHDNKIIGECRKIFAFGCTLEPTSTGVYNMSTDVDLPVVNVTIKKFDCATSGNYSCFKYPGTPNITKCAKDSSTFHPITTPDTRDSIKVCKIARGVVGGIGLLCSSIAIGLLLYDRCNEQLFNDCSTKTRCWTISSLVLGVCIVSMAMGIVDFTTPCEEEWSELNGFAIVFGSVGDALLIVTCIATIMIVCIHSPPCDVFELHSSIRTSTKDLHYGLVYSHIEHFKKIYEAAEQLFNEWCEECDNKLIKRFLLVIPNNCELTSEILKSSALCTLNEINFKPHEEDNVYKLKLCKLTMGQETYYVFAEVPTVLTVISSLSQTLRNKTIAGVVRQKFQLLYQRELHSNRWDNTVQFVTCKGEDDIARALFGAAKALNKAAKALEEYNKRKESQKAAGQQSVTTITNATISKSDEAAGQKSVTTITNATISKSDEAAGQQSVTTITNATISKSDEAAGQTSVTIITNATISKSDEAAGQKSVTTITNATSSKSDENCVSWPIKCCKGCQGKVAE
ncbi:uncharacterized protein LOC127834861 isoform X7 [Dreissena polymorpha]|uniref:uncharacterized protein LOC127834861 isoform X7 n=1 Tax=Dreissena polymorpha TaxID=45954 RepID=UPI0022656B4F|nr:uncharacterized protein LOC127834861 isoform X7 [Dreissena polymorpha]